MQVFSYGNAKLPKETLIVNITSAVHCPSERLGFCRCSKVCYAKNVNVYIKHTCTKTH